MIAHRFTCTSFCVVVLLAGSACKNESQARTTLPAAWRNAEFSGQPFRSFFVVGIAKNGENRRLYEDSMARALQEQGATARASWTEFPEDEKLDLARVLLHVQKEGFDSVVIARLTDVHETQVYVPARPLTSSDEFMAGYDAAYAVNSDPAHYEKMTTYRVETTVYSVRDTLLAWVVLSDTVNPESVADVIQAVSFGIAERMKAEGLVADPP